uniref:Bromo domain-containing protein n=1 Tax=Echinostoma caproni TaxID=27848 RepID=A0A183B4P7_9TREM
LTEEERARKIHRKEPLGSDRSGRTYWYIGRRILVEPTDFTQREPCLPGVLDGVYDPHWQQAYADSFLDDPDLGEDYDEQHTTSCFPGDDSEDFPECPLRRIRCNPSIEYANEPPVYYYSTFEQVAELRACLSMRWEPWLCQRLDALMPRLQTEMLVTQQLTASGLDTFCRMRPDHERIELPKALDWTSLASSRSHVTRVFALLEAEARQSQLRMHLECDKTEEALEYRSIDALVNAPPTLGLDAVKPRAPDVLPEDLLNELPAGEESAVLGALVTCDANTCIVRNLDGLLVRVNKPEPTAGEKQGICNTVFDSTERATFALTCLTSVSPTSSIDANRAQPTLRAYRLSDEGTWRSWSNLYTVGVWVGPEESSPTERSRTSRETNRSNNRIGLSEMKSDNDNDMNAEVGDRRRPVTRSRRAINAREGEEKQTECSTAPVNVILSRTQVAEDRERRRVLGNKFNFTETATELWNYVEPPLMASFYTDLVELLRCPCALDDNLFRSDWSASPWQSVDVIRMTIAYMEAQFPLAFLTPAWLTLRKRWLAHLVEAKTLSELADALALLEASIRPLCYQRIWFGSVGRWLSRGNSGGSLLLCLLSRLVFTKNACSNRIRMAEQRDTGTTLGETMAPQRKATN